MNELEKRIIDIIAKIANIEPASIQLSSTLGDFQVPSINQLEIMFAIEEEFDIYLADQADGLTLFDLAQLVQSLIDRKNEQSDLPH